MKKKGNTTVKDIARESGYSAATVSKALNGYKDIPEETVKKIREVAERLNYTPNAAARQLKTKSSRNIGVLFEDRTGSGLTHEYFAAILDGIRKGLEINGYDMSFISKSEMSTYLQQARYRKYDGIIIASADFRDPEVVELAESEIPVLAIDYSYPNRSSVHSDNVDGGYTLTRHLLKLGHKKIAVIHGEDTLVTRSRLNGFYRAMKEAGVTVKSELIRAARYHDPESTAYETEMLLRFKDEPTAIMFPDDYAFLGGLKVLSAKGVKIPEEISVTGYDGMKLANMLVPKLTTYFQDADEIGKRSAQKLMECIEDPVNCVQEQIGVKGYLLKGESTTAPRKK